jgi:type VI secretion system protein ImpF
MPTPSVNQPLLPSLLDRLTSEPSRPRRAGMAGGQALGELKQSVARDLQRLLNTRTTWERCQPHQRQLARSLLTYGLPDFGGVAWGDYESRAQLLKLIQSTLEYNEPRLRSIRVTFPKDAGDGRDRTLRFRIEAELRVEPLPEPVTFDAVQDPTYARFEVRRAGMEGPGGAPGARVRI